MSNIRQTSHRFSCNLVRAAHTNNRCLSGLSGEVLPITVAPGAAVRNAQCKNLNHAPHQVCFCHDEIPRNDLWNWSFIAAVHAGGQYVGASIGGIMAAFLLQSALWKALILMQHIPVQTYCRDLCDSFVSLSSIDFSIHSRPVVTRCDMTNSVKLFSSAQQTFFSILYECLLNGS